MFVVFVGFCKFVKCNLYCGWKGLLFRGNIRGILFDDGIYFIAYINSWMLNGGVGFKVVWSRFIRTGESRLIPI